MAKSEAKNKPKTDKVVQLLTEMHTRWAVRTSHSACAMAGLYRMKSISQKNAGMLTLETDK